MRAHNRKQLEFRKQVEAARTELDGTTCPQQIALVARDAFIEAHEGVTGAETKALETIASIPPVVLGKRTFTVVAGGTVGLELIGPRGGHSSLVRNDKKPNLWAHVTMAGYNAKTVWYKRLEDGSFVEF